MQESKVRVVEEEEEEERRGGDGGNISVRREYSRVIVGISFLFSKSIFRVLFLSNFHIEKIYKLFIFIFIFFILEDALVRTRGQFHFWSGSRGVLEPGFA